MGTRIWNVGTRCPGTSEREDMLPFVCSSASTHSFNPFHFSLTSMHLFPAQEMHFHTIWSVWKYTYMLVFAKNSWSETRQAAGGVAGKCRKLQRHNNLETLFCQLVHLHFRVVVLFVEREPTFCFIVEENCSRWRLEIRVTFGKGTLTSLNYRNQCCISLQAITIVF